MTQPTFQFTESPVIDWPLNGSLYSTFKAWKLRYKNTLKVELASLPDTRKGKTLLRC